MLEDGLRTVFRVFRDGLSCSELSVTPLGGALFGAQATPLLDRLAWGERAVALLLDRLLWTTPKGRARERVHYGALDVEDLGRVYEALLELEPGITTAPMSRLRRAKLEVVLPAEHAARYRGNGANDARTRVTWVEDIPSGRFFLRAGVGRKATGSYYTPHAFVRFLVRETLAPQIAERSPDADPDPAAILALKVVDPATGSGHFLVEACRYLGEALYAACRMCDESAAAAEDAAANARRRMIVRACWRAPRRCVGAWRTCPIRMVCCWHICQAGRARAARAVCRNSARWRYADGWSPCTVCTGWTTTGSPSNWQSCRSGWSPMPRDCR